MLTNKRYSAFSVAKVLLIYPEEMNRLDRGVKADDNVKRYLPP